MIKIIQYNRRNYHTILSSIKHNYYILFKKYILCLWFSKILHKTFWKVPNLICHFIFTRCSWFWKWDESLHKLLWFFLYFFHFVIKNTNINVSPKGEQKCMNLFWFLFLIQLTMEETPINCKLHFICQLLFLIYRKT